MSMATTGTEKHARIVLTLSKGGTRLARHLLEVRVSQLTPTGHIPTPWTVDQFLISNKYKILASDAGKKKEKTYFPGIQDKTNLDHWDLCMFCHVLLRTCELDPETRMDVHELRSLRNKLTHLSEPSLDEVKYTLHMSKLEAIFGRFLKRIGDCNLDVEIKSILESSKNGELSLSDTYGEIYKFFQIEREIREVISEHPQAFLDEHQIELQQLPQGHTTSTLSNSMVCLQHDRYTNMSGSDGNFGYQCIPERSEYSSRQGDVLKVERNFTQQIEQHRNGGYNALVSQTEEDVRKSQNRSVRDQQCWILYERKGKRSNSKRHTERTQLPILNQDERVLTQQMKQQRHASDNALISKTEEDVRKSQNGSVRDQQCWILYERKGQRSNSKRHTERTQLPSIYQGTWDLTQQKEQIRGDSNNALVFQTGKDVRKSHTRSVRDQKVSKRKGKRSIRKRHIERTQLPTLDESEEDITKGQELYLRYLLLLGQAAPVGLKAIIEREVSKRHAGNLAQLLSEKRETFKDYYNAEFIQLFKEDEVSANIDLWDTLLLCAVTVVLFKPYLTTTECEAIVCISDQRKDLNSYAQSASLSHNTFETKWDSLHSAILTLIKDLDDEAKCECKRMIDSLKSEHIRADIELINRIKQTTDADLHLQMAIQDKIVPGIQQELEDNCDGNERTDHQYVFTEKLRETVVNIHKLVILTCKLNVSDMEVTWLKDSKPVEETDNLMVVNQKDMHWLAIPRAKLTDSGCYSCKCGNAQTEAFLKVTGSRVKTSDFSCGKHKGTQCTWYCSDHDRFCCSECKDCDHSACVGIKQVFPKRSYGKKKQSFTFKRKIEKFNVNIRNRLLKKEENDMRDCLNTSICMLPNGTILLADGGNYRLKKLDSSYNVISHCDIRYIPYGLCYMGNGRAAVSLRDKGIQFVHVPDTDIMKLEQVVQLDHPCNAMTCHDGTLYVSDRDTVYTYNRDCQEKHVLYMRQNLEKYIYNNGIAVSDDGERIYITCRATGLVTIDKVGNHMFALKSDEVKDCLDVCVVGNGTVLVLDRSGRVYQVDYTGKKVLGKVVNQSDSVDGPVALCYDRKKCKIIIANAKGIKAFDLTNHI